MISRMFYQHQLMYGTLNVAWETEFGAINTDHKAYC